MDKITYRIIDPDGQEFLFPVDLRLERVLSDEGGSEEPPQWARLDNHQCSNCPLDPQQHPNCPAAVSIYHIASRFDNDLSITRVDVWVETATRTYSKNVDLQTCLRSLFGLMMATSGCPVLSRMRMLALFHLPFSNLDETILRIVGTYLIKQYLTRKHGDGEPDWELKGIGDYYRELGVVNIHLMKRLRQASQEDANVNAIQQFVSIAMLGEMDAEGIMDHYYAELKRFC